MKLIETRFPLIEINIISEYESSFLKAIPREVKEKLMQLLKVTNAKGVNLPKLNNLFYYPARIPPSATRAVTLASLINGTVDKNEFLDALGLSCLSDLVKTTKKLATLYMINPEHDLIAKLVGDESHKFVVVDPMAGGGSIPLEAKRLGFTVITGDYNPVSYLLLRVSIEFPAKYGIRLYELVNEEAKKLIEYVKIELGGYYPKEDKCYIFVPSIEHECGAVIPLIKETVLRKGDKRKKRKGEDIYVSWKINEERKEIQFKISNRPSPPLRICPFCKKPISVDFLRKKWIQKHKEVLERLLQGDESVVEEVPKLYRLIAVSITTTKYREPTQQDEEILVKSAKELARIARKENIAEYLPMFLIPEDNDVFKDVRKEGLELWHQLFTPRQLLLIYKVIKYLRERAKALKKAYGELGVAVVLYLALGFAKALNFNSLLTQWDSSQGSIRDLVGSQYALSRKVRLGYDFVDANIPFFTLEWAFEVEEGEESYAEGEYEVEATAGGMLPVLKVLCEALDGLWYEGKDMIYLWDAKEIDKHLPPASVDLVNVDPPYYDQHNYAGITEFFWVILQTILRPILDDLFPKDRVKIEWDPYSPEIPKNIEMHGKPPLQVGGISKFGKDFTTFLKACSKVLKPDGLVVVWYAYGKLSGWEELFYRFYEAGYAVTKTWQVWTQSPQRRVALHTKAFFTSMVIVARPMLKRQPIFNANDPRLTDEVSKIVRESLSFILNTYGIEHLREALVVSMADGIAGATMFEIPSTNPLMYTTNFRKLLNKALEVATNSVLKELTRFSYSKIPEIGLDNISRLYLMLLIAAHREQRSGQLRISHDFANRLSQVLRAPLYAVIIHRQGGREFDVLISPEDMANRNHTISESLRLIYNISEKLIRGGIRSAEEYAKEHSSYAPLALVVATLAWDKLGIDNVNKELVLNTLRKVIG